MHRQCRALRIGSLPGYNLLLDAVRVSGTDFGDALLDDVGAE